MFSTKLSSSYRYPGRLLMGHRYMSDTTSKTDPKHFYPNTSVGIKERSHKPEGKPQDPLQTPYPPFPEGKNPKTGEVGGPSGPEPTRFGDWERKGRVTDF